MAVTIVANRMKRQLEAAWAIVSSTQQLPSEDILFSYSAGRTPPLELPQDHRLLRVISSTVHNRFADKGRLPKIAEDAGVAHVFPKTVFSVDEALSEPCDLWYSKDRYGTFGRGMRVLRSQDLQGHELEKNHVLQAAVKDVLLFVGRKYVCRVYLLIWNGAVYFSPIGLIKVHGMAYEPNSTDPKVQISSEDHDMQRFSFQEMQGFSPTIDAIRRASKTLLPALKDLIEASSRSEYILLGLDYLPTEDGGRFIEINAFPNMVHDHKINTLVVMPVLAESIRIMIGEKPEIFDPLT